MTDDPTNKHEIGLQPVPAKTQLFIPVSLPDPSHVLHLFAITWVCPRFYFSILSPPPPPPHPPVCPRSCTAFTCDMDRYLCGDADKITVPFQQRRPATIQKATWETCRSQSSGAVWKSRWPSSAFRPNEPYGFCGRKKQPDIEPCFGMGHSLSLICQPTSEDMKLYITTTCRSPRSENSPVSTGSRTRASVTLSVHGVILHLCPTPGTADKQAEPYNTSLLLSFFSLPPPPPPF